MRYQPPLKPWRVKIEKPFRGWESYIKCGKTPWKVFVHQVFDDNGEFVTLEDWLEYKEDVYSEVVQFSDYYAGRLNSLWDNTLVYSFRSRRDGKVYLKPRQFDWEKGIIRPPAKFGKCISR